METGQSKFIPRHGAPLTRQLAGKKLLELVARLERLVNRVEDLEDRLDRQRRPYGDGMRLEPWRQ
jgi:hypothetical protein